MSYCIVAAYFAVLGLLMVYCLHRCLILGLYFRYRHAGTAVPEHCGRLPCVTVQLPIYNERYVVSRLLHAVAALDYPRELLEIQVLDDSTDETPLLARELAKRLSRQGLTIRYLHRVQRRGFKAGALQEGLAQASGELIAVFDADFVPERDFLRRIVPYFHDRRVGMVQSRWGHINRDYSLLTRLQAMFLDGHFMFEHTARNRSGRFFNFNGTAGVWRKACIADAGGWHGETLTEDLDLSYRAQLRGWRFLFVPEIVAPAEIPVDMPSFKSQQHRWAKGGIQTARKLLPAVFKSRQPLRVKLEALFHLTGNGNYLLVLGLALLAFPALVIRIENGWRGLLIVDLVCFLGSVLPIGLYYLYSQKTLGHPAWAALCALPALLALGIGLSVNNGRAVIEALAGRRSAFRRTPKFNIATSRDGWRSKRYRADADLRQIMVEAGLGIYFLLAVGYAAGSGVYASIPFLLLFSSGYLYAACLSLYHRSLTAPGGSAPKRS